MTVNELIAKYGKGPFKLEGQIIADFSEAIDFACGPKNADVSCILRNYMLHQLPAHLRPSMSPQDACNVDINLSGALKFLVDRNQALAVLLASKFKVKAPQAAPTPKPVPKPAPGKTPGKTPSPAQPLAAAVVAKPINWKPVLKWGGLVLVLTAGGYYAWQKLQAR